MSMWARCGGWIAMAGVVLAMGPASACNEVISWYADLKGTNLSPAVTSTASGRVTFVFDFEHPQATVTVNTQGLQDVEKIEIDACRAFSDMTGPAIVVLYDAKNGPLPATLTRTILDTDVVKIDKPQVTSMKDVANVVLNGQASVMVYTKAHPEGEIAGKIGMHKMYVYSDDPNSKYHDPSLHHGHDPAPTAPSTPVSPTVPPTPADPGAMPAAK